MTRNDRTTGLHPMTHDQNPADAQQDPVEEQAFSELYERLKKPIYNFFANRGCTREDARELRQDTFAEALDGRQRFRGDSKPETWIFGVAKNVWRRRNRDHNRLKRQGVEISIDGDDDPDAPGSLRARLTAADCPFEDAARAEKSRMMGEALQELPPIMRQCVLLWYKQELKYREIASVLQITMEQVKTNLSRGKRRLRESLQHRRADAR